MKTRTRFLFLGLLIAGTVAVMVAVAFEPTAGQAPSLRFALDRVTDAKAAVDRLGQTVARATDAEEAELGNEIAGEFGIMAPGPSTQDQMQALLWLQDVARHLQNTGGLKRGSALSYTVSLVESPHPNAFALPGGHLFVTTGMVDFLENEAEAAALLGHEMAHVDLRHCIERYQYALKVREVAGRPGETLGHLGTKVLLQGYQDDQELEADRWGMILATRAGYHPQGGQMLFSRLRRLPALAPRTVPDEVAHATRDALEAYLASHPNPDQRITAMEEIMEELGLSPEAREYVVGVQNCRDRVCVTRRTFPGEQKRTRFPMN